ncbi:winged helix-turn-helix domain-containing protein [Sandarakinorhabdus sp. DWP1-3-1]|uniref:winged helix-turn-helix domain-containing protein n=1 Tax=Sandarakinorhabdus sp. DWP1-3-1 TaxID=2804627 RepID=UPI003CF16C65
MAERPPSTDPSIWFRLLLPTGALGPGKIALMRAVAATGSVSAAARSLGMSHARSVKLVAEINALASTPLIDTRAGGPSGGGASLSPLGHAVVGTYAEIEGKVAETTSSALAQLSAMLVAPPKG